jgi:Family of unknown function (DUF5719)
MPDLRLRDLPLRGRRALVVGAALAGALLLLGAGTVFGPEAPASNANRVPLVGRTTTICSTTPPTTGQPAPMAKVSAVAIREVPDRSGVLTGSTLDAKETGLKITQQGRGDQSSEVAASILVAGEGAMATTGSAVIVGDIMEGPEAGLKAAPCLPPGTLHWFSGLGATEEDGTELILTNPDDAQAQVDLRFYGPSGRLAAPGGAGVEIRAHESFSVLPGKFVQTNGPLSVAVQATEGRVTAVAKRRPTHQDKPAGVDWQVPSAPPSPVVVLPGIPAGDGNRQLVVTNPGNSRAVVGVQVLGVQGPYEPSGAASVDVAPESTASVRLEGKAGLAGEAGSVKLTSNVPVTAAVISTSRRAGDATDLAVQSAAVPLLGTGVSALATSNIFDSELIVSNFADADAQLTFEVLNYDGVRLRADDIFLGPNSTATRRLNSDESSYVVVKVPDGSSVVGGVVLTQPDRKVAGLATIPLGSPDAARRAPATRPDYSVGH